MNRLFLVLLTLGLSQIAVANNNLNYNCIVSQWDSSTKTHIDCGDVKLNFLRPESQELSICGVSVSSSALNPNERLAIHFGIIKHSDSQINNETVLAFYPKNAPEEFVLELSSGNRKYKRQTIECTLD